MTEHREIANEIARKLACVEILRKKLAELEAEPGIVTFESYVDAGLSMGSQDVLRPLEWSAVHVAVSREPFVSYKGVELARGEFAAHVFDGGMAGILTNNGYREIAKFVSKHAKPGSLVVVIDPDGGGE